MSEGEVLNCRRLQLTCQLPIHFDECFVVQVLLLEHLHGYQKIPMDATEDGFIKVEETYEELVILELFS